MYKTNISSRREDVIQDDDTANYLRNQSSIDSSYLLGDLWTLSRNVQLLAGWIVDRTKRENVAFDVKSPISHVIWGLGVIWLWGIIFLIQAIIIAALKDHSNTKIDVRQKINFEKLLTRIKKNIIKLKKFGYFFLAENVIFLQNYAIIFLRIVETMSDGNSTP